MRDIWYRRVVAGVLLASAAVLAIGRRLRPRPAPQSDRPVPSTTPPARLTLQTTCAPSILQNHATPIGAAWFATACGLCLAAAAAVSSMQAPTFHNLASIFDLTAIGFALGGIITIGWRLRTRARHWPLWSWRFSGLCATIILAFVAADGTRGVFELVSDHVRVTHRG